MALDRINATALLDGGVTTADIADDAVTTAKLATQTGNVDFADNGKIRLGDSQDLEIGHTSAHSDIKETGTGDLRIWGNDIKYYNSAGNKFHAQMVSDGAVSLYNNGQIKLSTTSTGVDVTGSVNAVGGRSFFASDSDAFATYLRYNDSTAGVFVGSPAANEFQVSASSGAALLNIDSNGRVGIGTGNPPQKFVVSDAGADNIVMAENSSASIQMFMQAQAGVGAVGTLTNHDIVFLSNNSEKGRFLAGGGLTFNGDTAAANALDDYEEGTWTAQIIGSTTNPSSAVTMPTATYTKIGRLVFAQFQFSNVNTTGASGGVRVSGLPFASNTAHGTGNILTYVGMTFPTTSTNISPYVSGTEISFYYSTSNQGWAEITHNATSGVYLAVTVTYQTNA